MPVLPFLAEVIKHVDLQPGTHKRLCARKANWGMKTLDLTVERLLNREDDRHHHGSPSTTDDAGTKKYPNTKDDTTRKKKD